MNLPNTVPPLDDNLNVPSRAMSSREYAAHAASGKIAISSFRGAVNAGVAYAENRSLVNYGIDPENASVGQIKDARERARVCLDNAWAQWAPNDGDRHTFEETIFPTERGNH